MPKKTKVEAILKQAGIKINGSAPYDVQVHDDRFYNSISKGDLGIGEAYMNGWWSTKRLDQTMVKIVESDARNKILFSFPLLKLVLSSTLTNRQNSRRANKNAKAHYNIGNDLYELMLDKRMIYTCGFWESAKTLDEAQVAKLDRICKKLHLKPGMTVLDIGCGWGGFAKFASEILASKLQV
jgi:cyclopropane-fatty-acyl-phospholipid synthase